MTGNGDSVLKVVELFIDNINESTKNLSQGMDRLEIKVEGVKSKVNTPPRNEELSEDHGKLDIKLDTAISAMLSLQTSIKLMTNAVRVAIAVLGLAALISGSVVYFGNRSLVNQLSQQQNKELNILKKDIQDLKGKGVIDENISGKNG